ncbi:Transcription factor [Diaporthe australafricana]|uniref:Transcription factor n=1 Tax=Diaporthe australafricana TaxID=127596 RepID=A0ABR3Y1Z6_9PEZI
MSSPEKSSPPRDGANGQDEKPRLTEEQKRQNHISSEQKRRQAIRDGFDKMASIVPGLEGQGRSEGHVLNVSVQFILEQIEERRQLVEQVEARGGVVSDELKAPLNVDLSKVNLEHLQQQRNGSAGGPAM